MILFSNLRTKEIQFKCKTTWIFFATFHGKGAVDSIDYTVKQSVSRQLKLTRIMFLMHLTILVLLRNETLTSILNLFHLKNRREKATFKGNLGEGSGSSKYIRTSLC